MQAHRKISRTPRLNIGQYWKNYKRAARDPRISTVQAQRGLFARVFKPRVSPSTRFILTLIENELAQGMTSESFQRAHVHALSELELVGVPKQNCLPELKQRYDQLYNELQSLAALSMDVKLKQADLMRKGIVTPSELLLYNKFSHAFHNEAHRRILFLSELIHSVRSS
ncbi:MAG: hypothetical protein Q7S92_01280 [Candidatus Diapherotrites archaeon]|nr:hypothetical protein [Candidatus Diapherotrites archaeon]